MKTPITIITTIVAILCARSIQAEEPYWPNIKNLLAAVQADDQKNARAAEEYLRSLSSAQLIVAGRQCSQEIETSLAAAHMSPDDADMVGMALRFFDKCYSIQVGNQRNLDLILAEIADNQQSVFWRWNLVRFLGEWPLTAPQRFHVIDRLSNDLRDTTMPLYVRGKMPHTIGSLLAEIHWARKNDRQQSEEKDPLAVAVQKYVTISLDLLSSSNTPVELQEKLLGNVVGCHQRGLPGSDRVKDAVSQAIQDYKSYPEQLWEPLLKAAKRMNIDSTGAVIQQMEQDCKKASDVSTKAPSGSTNETPGR